MIHDIPNPKNKYIELIKAELVNTDIASISRCFSKISKWIFSKFPNIKNGIPSIAIIYAIESCLYTSPKTPNNGWLKTDIRTTPPIDIKVKDNIDFLNNPK